MNGIEKITQKINADAQGEISRIQADAQAQCAHISAAAAAEITAQREEILARGQHRAEERKARLLSAAQMEARKLDLAARQDVIGQAFDGAIHSLCSLDEKEYIDLLTRLAVAASTTGSEALIFSQKDRAQVGKQVVMAANALLLAGAVSPTQNKSKVAAAIGVIADVATAKLSGSANLTLSEETRDIMGGFILDHGDMEVNCAFETLVRLQRDALEGDVAAILFQ